MHEYLNGIPGLLFQATIPTSTTQYVAVPVRNGSLGAFVSWKDAVANATITLELTSHPAGKSPQDPGSAATWSDSGETITGPSAVAAGSVMINVDNVRQRYARLKIVTSAVSPIEVWDGTEDS